MIIIRPVRKNDLNALYALSSRAKAGLTTLPHDKRILKSRVDLAVLSFQMQVAKPGNEYYLFVMEDLSKGKIIGTTGSFAKVGGFEPSYRYEIKTVGKYSKTLKVRKSIGYLQLSVEHNGPSEIGTLFLDPRYRKRKVGRLLSLSRFLFMAQYRRCFESEVLAELRGVINSGEHSPFWEVLGKHFFEVDFKKADLMVMKDKTFIADLMPQHPIYIPLLPKSAQKVLGSVHKNTEPAMHLLLKEGFTKTNHIDIFEAGPVLKANVKDLRVVKKSNVYRIKEILDKEDVDASYLIGNVTSFSNFKVGLGQVWKKKDGYVCISRSMAEALGLTVKDKVRIVKQR